MNIEDTTLKACPFCGGEAAVKVSDSWTSGHGQADDKVSCGCVNCGAAFSSTDYAGYGHDKRKREVVEKWNTREGAQ